MGIGDWIMATAEAKHWHEKEGLPVVFFSRKTNKVQWSEVFRNNPRILKEPANGQKVKVIENHGGKRPYIKEIHPDHLVFDMDFKAVPGEFFLTADEKKRCSPGCVIVEPHTKEKDFSRNKAWPWERWQELVDSISLPWVQVGPPDTRSLKGVTRAFTKSFRDALGYINSCSLVVTTDGALHHAAAALGRPAVVLWGGLAPMTTLGYDAHTNICMTDRVCGSINSCNHCKEAMESITVQRVREAIEAR
jgi:ADP-heptose:LPS heptosyltransferase